jgi:hypothetical protein
MKALQDLRHILKTIAGEVEGLPAVGNLERPDFEEREDRALIEDEKVFETVFERAPSAPAPRLYRPVPPVGRTERHLFRYFLHGSFRSLFLGTAPENERESPIHFAQIGACVLRRKDNGSVRREKLQVDHSLRTSHQTPPSGAESVHLCLFLSRYLRPAPFRSLAQRSGWPYL